MSIYDKASLVLIPSGTKTSKVYSQKPVNGDGDFTFSRSTAATRVNADGNIEKETQNRLLQSNSFDTTWGIGNYTSIVSGQSGYDGTNDAWLWTASNGTFTNINQTNLIGGGVATLSVYVKAANTHFVALQPYGSGSAYIKFNLSTGAVHETFGSPIDYGIEAVSGGWYRCYVTDTYTSSQVSIYLLDASGNFANTSTDSIYIQDAQLEQGLVARDYIETTTAAVEGGITDNVPRLDYTDSSCPALLLEPQRTNLYQHSEYIAGWTTPTSQGFESNSIVSPEGVQNATKIINTNGSSSWIRQLPSVTIGQKQVISCFVKEGNRDIFNITYYDVTDGDRFFNYNLSTEAISGNGLSHATYVDSGIEDYGNGWFRCYVVITAGNATPQIQMAVGTNRSASANDYIYVWGAQHEQNASYPTSYIPTYGTSVTRLVDKPLVNPQNLLDATEGSWFVNFADMSFDISGTSGPSVYIGYNQSNYLGITNRSLGNVNQVLFCKRESGNIANLHTIISQSGNDKFCFTWNGSNLKLFVNGTKVYDDDNFANFIVWDDFVLGNDARTPQYELKQTLLFSTQITDQEAIDLTTI